MRKLVVLTFVTLDGVMQAPGGPDEDKSGGFRYGGWTAGYWDDMLGREVGDQMAEPFDLLLGRKTYEIFANYWPNAKKDLDIAVKFNNCTKYVASRKLKKLEWKNSVLLRGDVANEIKKIKAQDGPALHVVGSGKLAQTIFKKDLADELRLMIFPITLGKGKKLFAEGTIPAGFELIYSKASTTGVIVATYKRDGNVRTGSMA